MDLDSNRPLERSASHHSTTSIRSQRSQRSQTVRCKPRKYASYISSSASSIASSDNKSLTSFPSFSPGSPEDRLSSIAITDGTANQPANPAPSIKSLTTSPAHLERTALFDDAPVTTTNVPGSIHHANDEHIERLIARNGAVALVRQIAEDLARRDAQIATLRRKAEDRERALRKIILECGLSNLDLETRLRAVEAGSKSVDESVDKEPGHESGLEDLMNDAMSESALGGLDTLTNDQTIRAKDVKQNTDTIDTTKEPPRGWKDYIWGTVGRKTSRASSLIDELNGAIAKPGNNNRPTVLQNDIFRNPSAGSASRASSIQAGIAPRDRKPSSGLAMWATKLVAGNVNASRDAEINSRGRSNSAGQTPGHRTSSIASIKTISSVRTVPSKPGVRTIPPRRSIVTTNSGTMRGPPQDRWDTMGTSPQSTASSGIDNYGPVEMDTILDPDAQPPTMTHIYNNHYNPEFLTDRFGFIYDQRRKKRQREAAEQVRKSKRGSRVETIGHVRGSSAGIDDEVVDDASRPATPSSNDDRIDDGKPTKRWQDYLKIATFPTELLSHTPSGSVPAFEVMEGGEVPKSPGIMAEERGFIPPASTTAAPSIPTNLEAGTLSKPDRAIPPSAALTKEDAEPVKLLLRQLGEVHDSLQRDKTVKWNDFLRKVRAERKREGEAAAAAFAAAAETKTQRPMTVMPEVSLADGEMIGIAGLGNKGKVGRAKWSEFKSLVLGGIPVAYRAKIWAECSGAVALRIPGYYDDLVAQNGEDDDPATVAQIQMDINRTLTDNIFFRKGPGVAKLNEVLLAYSRRNAEVGYCQGMNLITACLLLIMPTAEDAFWVLTSIIENILPGGYYDRSLMASRADQQVLRQYVASILPKLSVHLEDLSIELEALTFQWFLSVFTDCLSAEALFRVWDVILCVNDGSTFLFQVALALLKLNEQQLLQCSTPAGVYTYINHQMTNHAISIDGLIHASEGLRKVVRREDVESRRAKAIEAEKDLVKQREAKNALRRAERLAAANGNHSPPPEVIVSESATPTEEDAEGSMDDLTIRTPMPVEEERELSLG
ncbi:TBC domain-containing protein [Phlyctema vagabunda]|uniref:TBC domain-containing protein n=1 Tax=Phlyctema vagabunda TaxID=108571 RepID=A0ABR4PDT3_9HELO